MKKYKNILIVLFILIALLGLLEHFQVGTPKDKEPEYTTITLEKEPDFIGSNSYCEEIAIVTDGEVAIYNKDGECSDVELGVYVVEAYPLDGMVWVIDDKDNLYQAVYKEKNELVLSDVIFAGVKYFECKPERFAVVDESGYAYVWGNNDCGGLGIDGKEYIEEPTKIEYIDNVKVIKFYNMDAALITEDGELYVSGYDVLRDKHLNNFTKVTDMYGIQCLEGEGFGLAVCADGTAIEWMGFVVDDDGNVSLDYYKDVTSDTVIEYQFQQVILGSHFNLGINKDGELYYWGTDFLNKPKGKDDYAYLSEPQKVSGVSEVDFAYVGSYIAYAKNGLEITILK